MDYGLCDWCQTSVFTPEVVAALCMRHKQHHLLCNDCRDDRLSAERKYCTCEPFRLLLHCEPSIETSAPRKRVGWNGNDYELSAPYIADLISRKNHCVFCAFLFKSFERAIAHSERFPETFPAWLSRSMSSQVDFYLSLVPPERASSFYTWLDDKVYVQSSFRLYTAASSPVTYFRRIRDRLGECNAKHTLCDTGTHSPPSRLLEVRWSNDKLQVRLVSTDSAKYRYAALSYCWGRTKFATLELSNLAQFSQEIDLAIVPKTIADALSFCVSMDVQYLWVDAFCIVQDSLDDKAREISKMSDVYAGAVFTISVAAASSVSDGFLHLINRSRQLARHEFRAGVDLVLEYLDNEPATLSSEPIHHRAWTLQESMLSPFLISITSRGTLMRCGVETMWVDGRCPYSLEAFLGYPRASPGGAGDNTKISLHSAAAWHKIIENYSKRSLSFVFDKLLALAAIAAEYGKDSVRGIYLAGLWSSSIVADLLWSGEGAAAPTWVAPSWSWASRTHAVTYLSTDHNVDGSVVLVNYNVLPSLQAVPYGALISASITIRCGAIKQVWNRTGTYQLDDQCSDVQIGDELWYLELAWGESINQQAYWVGLIVKQYSDVFKRVGMYTHGHHAYASAPQKEFTIV